MAKGWAGRVAVVPGAEGLAYVPGEVLVKVDDPAHRDLATRILGEVRAGDGIEQGGPPLTPLPDADAAGYVLVKLTYGDTLGTVRLLRGAGLEAQPNHVFFADAGPGPWSGVQADPVYGHPVYGHPVYGHPVYGHPVYGHPVYGHPVYGHPVYGHPVYGHGDQGAGAPAPAAAFEAAVCQAGACCDNNPCLCERPRGAASLVYPNPVYARAVYSDAHGLRYELTGVRPSNALPLYPTLAASFGNQRWETPGAVRVAIIDTGWPLPAGDLAKKKGAKANADDPSGGTSKTGTMPDAKDEPDTDGDDYLDPVAGHGMFIAGLILQYAPGACVKVACGLSTYGDGNEQQICTLIDELVDCRDERPDVLNLSFGTYAPEVPKRMARSIERAIAAGIIVVASAGNDGTSRPQYPAAYPGVVSVAALGNDGPAPFSNWGHWVRACAPGVDVASTFWTYNGKTERRGGADLDQYEGWALWSGTSFAAPIVAAALAREVQPLVAGRVPPAPPVGETDQQKEEREAKEDHDRHEIVRKVVARVIDHPRLHRMACYGTVVNPPPSTGVL